MLQHFVYDEWYCFLFGKLCLTLFYLMSPAGSDFCSLLLFGNFYSFKIFSIGNSARTREEGKKKKQKAWELGHCIALEWTLCTDNFLGVGEYLTHIIGVQIRSVLPLTPLPHSLSSQLVNEKYLKFSICHTKSLKNAGNSHEC